MDRKLRAARRASGGAKNESKAGLEQQHRRNSTGMTGMDDVIPFACLPFSLVHR